MKYLEILKLLGSLSGDDIKEALSIIHDGVAVGQRAKVWLEAHQALVDALKKLAD